MREVALDLCAVAAAFDHVTAVIAVQERVRCDAHEAEAPGVPVVRRETRDRVAGDEDELRATGGRGDPLGHTGKDVVLGIVGRCLAQQRTARVELAAIPGLAQRPAPSRDEVVGLLDPRHADLVELRQIAVKRRGPRLHRPDHEEIGRECVLPAHRRCRPPGRDRHRVLRNRARPRGRPAASALRPFSSHTRPPRASVGPGGRGPADRCRGTRPCAG